MLGAPQTLIEHHFIWLCEAARSTSKKSKERHSHQTMPFLSFLDSGPLTRLFLLCQLKFESLIPALLRRAFQLLGLHDELLDGVLLLQLRQNTVDELGQLRVPLLDGDGVAVTSLRDVEIHGG